jgi:hypothetical protein
MTLFQKFIYDDFLKEKRFQKRRETRTFALTVSEQAYMPKDMTPE